MDNKRRLTILAHGTLLNVMCQPEWEGGLGRMDTHICMAESLFCPPETIPALFIGYTPIQNKKFGKNEKAERERRKGRGGQSSQRLKNWSPRPKGRGGQDPHNPR